jgi:Transcriptional regulators
MRGNEIIMEKKKVSTETLIKKGYPLYSKSEKMIADYVLQNILGVADMTLSKLSNGTGLSEPSIMRFVKQLGFKGYSDFKRSILLDSSIQSDAIEMADHPTLTIDTPLEKLPENIVGMTCMALQDTLSVVDVESYKKAVELIKTSNKIHIFGVGYSGNVANDLMMRFVRIGIDCRAQADSGLQQVGANSLKKGDLAIGISFSGRTISIINALKSAKEGGAATIAITSYRSSEINKYADISLLASDMPGKLIENTMISRILQTVVTDILYMGVYLSDYKNYSDNYERSLEIIQKSENWRKKQ